MQPRSNKQQQKAQDIKALKPDYATFLRSNGGKDFLKKCEEFQSAAILVGINAKTADEKANAVSLCEGIIRLRDYAIRMSKD